MISFQRNATSVSTPLWDRPQQHVATCHPAPHGRSEEVVRVLDVEVLKAVFLKGGGEVLRLLADELFVRVEVLGDAGEEAPRGRTRCQVVGLDGELDVQDFSVGAEHVPRHVDLDKHPFLIHDLQKNQQS